MNITILEGVGAVYAEKLKGAGVGTTEKLLKAAASRKGRQQLSAATGVSKKLLLEWVNRADLMRVNGVGEEYSDLLEAAGVDSVTELRNRRPDPLHKALVEINLRKKLVRRIPSLGEVERWVTKAKAMDSVVTH